MKTRVISAVVMLAITGICVLLCMETRVILFAVAGILCAYELSKNLEKMNIHIAAWVLIVYLVLQAVLTIFNVGFLAYIACFAVAAYLALFTGIVRPSQSGSGAVCTLAGLVYPCFLFSMVMVVSVSNIWKESFALACFPVWLCDSFALFGGKRFGKHKLAAHVSPNKTVEGALCGELAGVLTGVAIYFLSGYFFSVELPLWVCAATALISATMGQIGDLAESLVKRMIGVKDFSNLIPGHGGMFDRADSLLFAIPSAYLCVLLFLKYTGVY